MDQTVKQAMTWYLFGGRKRQSSTSVQQSRISAIRNAVHRQELSLNFVKREHWTEEEVASLPKGEHDYFDRKAGMLFDNSDRNKLYDVLAKEASAFANSGGGHLVLGVTDDGNFDGVPRLISGRTSTRDWLEQKIPELLDYRLNDFRVHEVVRSEQSKIPEGREVIVVDFADSALAPHQSRRHSGYFYRSAGRTILAPHFYLELLRQRLTSAALDFSLESAAIEQGWEHDGSLFLRIVLQFAKKTQDGLRHISGRWRRAELATSPPTAVRTTFSARYQEGRVALPQYELTTPFFLVAS